MKKTDTVTVLDTKGTVAGDDDVRTETQVDLLTIGASGVSAFAGMNGGTDDALGLSLTGVDFALVLASEKKAEAGKAKRQWTALKAEAEEVSFVGIEGLTVSAETLKVEVNRSLRPGRARRQ